MIYVKNIYAKIALSVLVLWFASTSCSTPKVLSTNVPNYSIATEGKSNKPGILLFIDPAIAQNDSIIKYLSKEYFVITISRTYSSTQRRMNEDHPLLRSTIANELLEELTLQHTIEACGATGLEVPGNLNWMVNTQQLKLFFFTTYAHSIEDHIKESMYTQRIPLSQHQSQMSATELYELLNSNQNPSGLIGSYSIRFVKDIWKQQPRLILQAYEGSVEYKTIK